MEGQGQPVHKRMGERENAAWASVQEACRNGTTITGAVRGRSKGGFQVHCQGLRCHLPDDMISSTAGLVGSVQDFYVTTLNPASRTAQLSMRPTGTDDSPPPPDRPAPFSVGDRLTGKVVALPRHLPLIAHLELPAGIIGILHRDDLSWHPVGAVAHDVALGDSIDVEVLACAPGEPVRVGARKLVPDPWADVASIHPSGARRQVTIKSVKQGKGVRVRLADGFCGWVAAAEASWTVSRRPEFQFVSGTVAEAEVIGHDVEGRLLRMSLRRCQPNPWELFKAANKQGKWRRGKVIHRVKAGLIVNINGLSGLVPAKLVRGATAALKPGADIVVQVKEVDVERCSMLLVPASDGERRGTDRPRLRAQVTATVTKVQERAVRLVLDDGTPALLPLNELAPAGGGEPAWPAEGDEIAVVIINIAKGRAVVSQRATPHATRPARAADHEHDPGDRPRRRGKRRAPRDAAPPADTTPADTTAADVPADPSRPSRGMAFSEMASKVLKLDEQG